MKFRLYRWIQALLYIASYGINAPKGSVSVELDGKPLSNWDYYRVGVYSGTLPTEESDPQLAAFRSRARAVILAGQIVPKSRFSERITQIIKDEQQYARQILRRV